MFKILRLLRPYRGSVFRPGQRTFFSESLQLSEAWDKRLLSPILQKVQVDDLYVDLDAKYNQTSTISAVDVDIFANAVRSEDHLDEIEDLVHKLRLTAETGKTLPSTHHALIRNFIKFGDPENLLRILHDRLNYGIFPDDYSSLLLLDFFIKRQDFRNATKIALLSMLQEDFSNPLIAKISAFSCLKYMEQPSRLFEVEETTQQETNEDEEEDVTYVRVKFLRNPYFDNHFDLTEDEPLLGKTFMALGDSLEGQIGRTLRLKGSGMFGRFDIAKDSLQNILSSKEKIYEDALVTLKESSEKITEEALKKEIVDLIEKTEKEGLVEKGDLVKMLEEDIKQLVAKEESNLISQQIEIFKEWENQRDAALRESMDNLKKAQRLKEVASIKESLAKKEEELFFFENEDQIDLKIDNKRVRYPPKWPGKKKKKRMLVEEYVPPEIVQNRAG